MGSDHVLTVLFDEGDTEYVTLKCRLTGSDRPCAVINCPVDHEDVSRECVEAHGAKAADECWAESWFDNAGREGMDTQALDPVSVPVHVYFDDGLVVEDV